MGPGPIPKKGSESPECLVNEQIHSVYCLKLVRFSYMVNLMLSSRAFIKMRDRIGPKTHPCGTHDNTGNHGFGYKFCNPMLLLRVNPTPAFQLFIVICFLFDLNLDIPVNIFFS